MASFIVSWAPGVVNITNQVMQYKLHADSSYTDYATISANTSTLLITGLDDNTIYDFRVKCNCASGDTLYTNVVSAIKILCPIISFTSAGNSIGYTFTPDADTDVDKYTVQLYKNGVLFIQQSYSSPFVGDISSSFTSLDYAEIYQVQLVAQAGIYVNNCGLSNEIVPVCVMIQDITMH